MIDANKLKKIKDSKELYHIYIEGDYLYMIRFGDYSDEIQKTIRLHEKGVNFAGPISQIELNDNQVVVEEYFAKGTTFEKMIDEYNFSSSLSSKQILSNYITFFKAYLEEIKIRAEANQSIYNKLISDIIEMNKENLTVDTCSLGNLFFDDKIGFSIIDSYPGNTLPDIKSLFRLIIGNIPNMICIENNQLLSNCIPKENYDEFMNYINMIINKYIIALHGIKKSCNYDDLIIDTNIVTAGKIDEIINMEKDTRIRISL